MSISVFEEAIGQSQLKIDRACRHVNEIIAVFEAYVETDFCKLVVNSDPEGLSQQFRIVASPISPAIGLAIGDAFHALSSVFDYLATGMMRARKASTGRIGFPSHETREMLWDSFAPPKPGKKSNPNRRIEESFPGFRELAANNVKSYFGGGNLVSEIRSADNIDKHNLIIPYIAVTSLKGAVVVNKTHNIRLNLGGSVGAGGWVAPAHIGSMPCEIENQGEASVEIRFPEAGEVFPGDPIIPTLIQCIDATAEASNIIIGFGLKALSQS